MKKSVLLFTILILSHLNGFCQSTIEGVVTDSLNIPIENVSICFKDSKENAITNSEGKFSIKTPINTKDILCASCLGFKVAKIDLTSIKTMPIKIILRQSTIHLNEVTVKVKDAKSIVNEAIQRLNKNYSDKKIKVNGIFKHLVKEDGQNKFLFDCNSNLYVNNYRKKIVLPKVGLYPLTEGEVVDYELFKSDKKYSHYTNPVLLMEKFYIKNHPFIFNFKDYNFWYDYQLEYEGDNVLKISFSPSKLDDKKNQFHGYLYIDEKTYGFLYFEYSLLPNKQEYIKFSKTGGWKNLESTTKVMYSKTDDTFNLKYIITSLTAKVYNNIDTTTYVKVFNFLSKNIESARKNVNKKIMKISVEQALDKIIRESDGKTFDKSKNYMDNFILQTAEEKRLKKLSMELQEQDK